MIALILVALPAAAGLPPQVRIVQWPKSGIELNRAESLEIEVDVAAADAFAGTLEMRIADTSGEEPATEIVVPLELAAGSRTQRALALPPGRQGPLLLSWWLRGHDGSIPVTGTGALQCPAPQASTEPAWLGVEDVPPSPRWLSSELVLAIEGSAFASLVESRRNVLLRAVACGRTLVIVRPKAPLPDALEREMRRDEASCWRGSRGEEIREIAYGLGTLREVAADVHAGSDEWPLASFALGSRSRRWQLLDLGPESHRPWWHPRAWVQSEVLGAGEWATPHGAAASAIARARRAGVAIAAAMLLISLGLVALGRGRRTSRPAMALGGFVLLAPFVTWLSLHRRPARGIEADLEIAYHDPRGLVSVHEITRWAGGSGGPNPSIRLCPEADSQISFPGQGLVSLHLEEGEDGCIAASPVAGLPSARRWVGASMRTPVAGDRAWDADVRWENGHAVGRVTALRRFDIALLALPPRVVALGPVEAGQAHDVGPMIEAALGGASTLLDADVHAAVEMALDHAGDGMPHPLVLIGVNHRTESAREPPLLVEVQGVEIAGDAAGSASHWGRVVPYAWSGPYLSESPDLAAVPAGGEDRGMPLPPQQAVDIGSSSPWENVDPASRALADPVDPSWLMLPVPANRAWHGEPGYEVLLRWNAPQARP